MQRVSIHKKWITIVMVSLLLTICLFPSNIILGVHQNASLSNDNNLIYLVRVSGNPLNYISVLSKYGNIRHVYPAFNTLSIRFFGASNLQLIQRSPGILSVEKNILFRISDLNNSSYLQRPQALLRFNATLDTSVDVIDVRRVWETFNFTGENVTVAVVDTGIDATHVGLDDLDDNSSTYDPKVIGWVDFVNNKTVPYDDNGHGSHVAGIIAGTGAPDYKYIGVAPKARLVGVKVLNSSGEGDAEHVLLGLQWLIDNKKKFNITVVNISFTSDEPSDGTDVVSLAVDRLVLDGMTVAVAAGNSGNKGIGSPAASLLAITVGSTTKDRLHPTLASTSSRGPTLDERIKPDVCAPGVGIMSVRANSKIGYVSKSGTSMAAPHVAGLVALIEDANNTLTPAEIKFILTNTSRPFYNPSKIPNNDEGYGLIQGMAAVKLALNFTSIPHLNVIVNVTSPQSYRTDFHITLSSETDNVSFYFLFYNTLTNEPSYIIFAMINKSQTIDISIPTDVLHNILNVSGDTQLTFTFVAYKIGYSLMYQNYSVSLVKSVPQKNSLNLWLLLSSAPLLFILGTIYAIALVVTVAIIVKMKKHRKQENIFALCNQLDLIQTIN